MSSSKERIIEQKLDLILIKLDSLNARVKRVEDNFNLFMNIRHKSISESQPISTIEEFDELEKKLNGHIFRASYLAALEKNYPIPGSLKIDNLLTDDLIKQCFSGSNYAGLRNFLDTNLYKFIFKPMSNAIDDSMLENDIRTQIKRIKNRIYCTKSRKKKTETTSVDQSYFDEHEDLDAEVETCWVDNGNDSADILTDEEIIKTDLTHNKSNDSKPLLKRKRESIEDKALQNPASKKIILLKPNQKNSSFPPIHKISSPKDPLPENVIPKPSIPENPTRAFIKKPKIIVRTKQWVEKFRN